MSSNAPPNPIQPDPLPPDVRIIECPASTADYRSSDNSKWTNILREPIRIQKGSEIRVSTNFIDQRGIDADIIQFTSSGNQQDNTHTLLTQVYITNDGYNSKTTSYDYMSRQNTPPILLDPGQDIGGAGYQATFENVAGSGSGTGFQANVLIQPYCIRPGNVSITAAGSNYTNGASFTIASSGDDFTGYIITDDTGGIAALVFTKPYSNNNPPDPNAVVVANNTLGSGATFSNTVTQNGYSFNTFVNSTRTDATRGTGYQRGDLLTIEQDSTATPIPVGKRPIFKVAQIYSGQGQITNEALFDQGYNYEKCPLLRWASVYDVNQNFSYGNNYQARTFTKGDGEQITIRTLSNHHTNDSCISSGTMILQREDEFAPGIFHQEFPELVDDANDTQAQIALFSPIAHLKQTPNEGGTFTVGYWNEGIKITTNNYSYLQNEVSVQANILSAYPPGSTVRLQFNDPNTPSYQNQVDLDAAYNNLIGGCYVVKSFTPGATQGVLYLSTYFGDNTYSGKGTAFEGYVGATVYPTNSNLKVQLVFSSDSDGLGAPTRAPEIYINTDGSGAISSWDDQDPGLDLGEGNRTGMTYTVQGYASTDRFLCLKTDYTNGFYGGRGLASFSNSNLTYNSGGAREAEMFIIPANNYPLSTDTSLEQGDRRAFRYATQPATIGVDLPATLANQGVTDSLLSDSSVGITDYISNGLYRQSGQTDSTSDDFDASLASLANHDTQTQLTGRDYSVSLPVINISYGGSGVIRPADPGVNTFYDGSVSVLVINIAAWAALGDEYNINTLPLYTTLEITPTTAGTPDTSKTVQMETGGFQKYDATNYYILIKTPDLHNNYLTYFPIIAANQAELASNTYVNSLINTAIQNYEGTAIDGVKLSYTIPLYFNNQIKFNWIADDKTLLNNGAVVATGPQNFFNSNDPNLDTITTNNNNFITYAKQALKDSYNSGGYYFLTRFTGTLTNSTDTNTYQYDNTDTNIFNNYGIFLPFSQLPPDHYAWRNDRTDPWTSTALSFTEPNVNYNSSTAYTDASNFWAYQPLYRQKTLTINKNFCVASDISGIWTRSAHSLQGAIDPTTGNEYVPANQTPLLQNEFVFPVYGSNNTIGPNGFYNTDTDRYPFYGGLEPGHVVGKCYINSDNDWLAGPLLSQLPTDRNNNNLFRFFYVFFRTPFTFIRGYDPLANNSGAPVFTPLTTVNQTADKIGNANDSKATPPVSGRTALDGTTMLDAGDNPVPTGYELGSASGNSSAVRFGTQQYYPIYYLDIKRRSEYPKAKASQFVGTTNLTLAFATDISSFTFQFFHQPYTSAFVDGQGGDNSIRVFYGNRKNGIYNHDTLSGINVINFCRPDFPRGFFSYNEVNNDNLNLSLYPYGINPLTDISQIGQRFLNKVGFTDADVGISNNALSSALAKTSYTFTQTELDITAKMDTGAPDTTIWCNNTQFNGTTGADIDSSDAILAQIPAPETLAGLESNNTKITPNIGAGNYILRKWGDMIFYPYSLNTSSNSFEDKAVVRFDNASSTYGSIGGLLLSNSNRGMGLPNTAGSTFNTDDDTIPRTLNPDCELYLAYTIACGSSFIQASLLPAKLPNGYLVILSSLMKQTPFYMSKASWVNAISVVNKTFLTGDYILSEGQLSFYTQEDMMISEITTEIKDTQFNAPTVLGPNSTIIYSITDYNPQVPRALPTIEQEQEQDMELERMIQEHIAYLQGKSDTSALQDANNIVQQTGLGILTGYGGSLANTIAAFRNQLEFHDIPRMNRYELHQFFQTPEGQAIQQNVQDLNLINEEVGRLAQQHEDLAIEAYANGPAARYEINRQRAIRANIGDIHARMAARIPNYFDLPRPLPHEDPEHEQYGADPINIDLRMVADEEDRLRAEGNEYEARMIERIVEGIRNRQQEELREQTAQRLREGGEALEDVLPDIYRNIREPQARAEIRRQVRETAGERLGEAARASLTANTRDQIIGDLFRMGGQGGFGAPPGQAGRMGDQDVRAEIQQRRDERHQRRMEEQARLERAQGILSRIRDARAGLGDVEPVEPEEEGIRGTQSERMRDIAQQLGEARRGLGGEDPEELREVAERVQGEFAAAMGPAALPADPLRSSIQQRRRQEVARMIREREARGLPPITQEQLEGREGAPAPPPGSILERRRREVEQAKGQPPPPKRPPSPK